MAVGRKNKKINARLQAGRGLDARLGRQKARREIKFAALHKLLQGALLPMVKLLLIFALTGFLLLGGYIGLAHSSLFGLRQVEINGASHLSRLDVLSAAGLGYHTNLLSLQPSQAEESIRELPWIIQVTVQRTLPDKLKINVQEETPYAIGLIEGELFYLNKALKPFAPFAYDQRLNLPVVSGLNRAELLKEDDELEEMLADGIKLLAQLNTMEEPLWGRLSQLDLSEQCIKVIFEDLPATIKLGRDADKTTLEQLRMVTEDLAQRNELKRTVLIDLSIEKRVIVRLGQYEA